MTLASSFLEVLFQILIPLPPALTAFIIAVIACSSELLSTKYPQTFTFLLDKSRTLYFYAALYGICAVLFFIALNSAGNNGTLRLSDWGLDSSWKIAFFSGLSIRAFLHIRLFSVIISSQPIPLGTETLAYIFEPSLLRQIDIDEFDAIRSFIEPSVISHPDLAQVKSIIKDNIPSRLSEGEKSAFIADVEKSMSVPSAMELFVRSFGKRSFKRVFPN
jgi:hypothetical protein